MPTSNELKTTYVDRGTTSHYKFSRHNRKFTGDNGLTYYFPCAAFTNYPISAVGYYWASNHNGSTSASCLYWVNYDPTLISGNGAGNGQPIRCVQETSDTFD
ncbi:MAG: hypothetical protein RR141_03165 [Rikenellaceae bacterium]